MRVNAYLLGTGPSTLTVAVYSSPYQRGKYLGDEDYGLEQLESRRLAYERGLSEGGGFLFDYPLRGDLPDVIDGVNLDPFRLELEYYTVGRGQA